MPWTDVREDREQYKFRNIDNETVVATIPAGGTNANPLAKYLEMTETSSTVETYEYYESSNKVTLYNTVVVTYTDATKDVLASVEWS